MNKKINFPISIRFGIAAIFCVPLIGYGITGLGLEISLLSPLEIISTYSYPQILVNLILVATGIGMVYQHRWAFLLFVSFGIGFFLYCWILGALSLFGIYYWNFQNTPFRWSLLVSTAVFLYIVLFVRSEVVKPYFAILSRGWRMSRRETVPIPLHWRSELGMEGVSITEDISETGCLIPIDEKAVAGLSLGDSISVRLGLSPPHGDELEIEGIPVRFLERWENGRDQSYMGIRFRKENPSENLKKLKTYLAEKFSPRYASDLPVKIRLGEAEYIGQFYNISKSGAYLFWEMRDEKTSDRTIPGVGEDLVLEWKWNGFKTEATAEVVWLNPKGEFGKPKGLGLKWKEISGRFSFFLYYLSLIYFDRIRR
jgi:hypothetical protein